LKALGISAKIAVPVLIVIAATAAVGYYGAPVLVENAFHLREKPAPEAQPIEGYSDIVEPKTSKAFCDRGAAGAFVGDVKNAMADFDEAIKLDPKNDRAYFGRALLYIDKEDYKKAHADFNEAIRSNPNESTYYLERGRTFSLKGDRAGALADYTRGIELNPKDPALYCARAYIHGLLKNAKGSVADLDAAEKLDPTDAWISFERANQKNILGDRKGALVDFQKALELYPEYPNAYLCRGRMYLESGLPADRKLAFKDFDTAVKLAGNNDPWPLEVRAGEYDAAGNKKAAAEDRKKAKEISDKQKQRDKRAKKKRFELITNPIVYQFASDALKQAQQTFGPAKVPIKRLYIYYRSGKSCQTVMVDEKRGIFAICMANDETADVYYQSLAHELIHLMNTRLADPYIEGVCSSFGDHVKAPPRRQLTALARKYNRGVVKIKFYAETYIMQKELESKLKLEGVAGILKYRAWNKNSKDWQHIDIDAWLKSLPDDKRIIARDIINKYADIIEEHLPDDGAYAFARPSDRGPYHKTWMHKEVAPHERRPERIRPLTLDGSHGTNDGERASEEPAAKFETNRTTDDGTAPGGAPPPDADRSSKTNEPKIDTIDGGNRLPDERLR